MQSVHLLSSRSFFAHPVIFKPVTVWAFFSKSGTGNSKIEPHQVDISFSSCEWPAAVGRHFVSHWLCLGKLAKINYSILIRAKLLKIGLLIVNHLKYLEKLLFKKKTKIVGALEEHTPLPRLNTSTITYECTEKKIFFFKSFKKPPSRVCCGSFPFWHGYL